MDIRGGIETIQTTALLKSARILRKVLETWEDLLSDSSERAPALTCEKNLYNTEESADVLNRLTVTCMCSIQGPTHFIYTPQIEAFKSLLFLTLAPSLVQIQN